MTVYLLSWEDEGEVVCLTRYKARKEKRYIVEKLKGKPNKIHIKTIQMSKRLLKTLHEHEGW